MRLAPSLCLLAACLLSPLAFAQKQTVCTVTINSADEKETFRKFLPADKYDFVELVERNRPDWLGSACEQKVSCDVLLISGHHVGSSRVDLQACKLEYSIVSPK